MANRKDNEELFEMLDLNPETHQAWVDENSREEQIQQNLHSAWMEMVKKYRPAVKNDDDDCIYLYPSYLTAQASHSRLYQAKVHLNDLLDEFTKFCSQICGNGDAKQMGYSAEMTTMGGHPLLKLQFANKQMANLFIQQMTAKGLIDPNYQVEKCHNPNDDCAYKSPSPFNDLRQIPRLKRDS